MVLDALTGVTKLHMLELGSCRLESGPARHRVKKSMTAEWPVSANSGSSVLVFGNHVTPAHGCASKLFAIGTTW